MKLEEIIKNIQHKKFWRDRKIMIPLLTALVINLVNWPYLYFQMHHSRQLVPLRYNILNGVGAIGHWTNLFSLPLYALIIFIINASLIYRSYEKEQKFLLRLLLISQIALQIVFLVALILIINL